MDSQVIGGFEVPAIFYFTVSTFDPLIIEFDSTPSYNISGSVTVPPEVPVDNAMITTTADTKSEENNSLNEKLIPIYCSILAAVVVGLVAFIIFKR